MYLIWKRNRIKFILISAKICLLIFQEKSKLLADLLTFFFYSLKNGLSVNNFWSVIKARNT